jgi:ComF family protein
MTLHFDKAVAIVRFRGAVRHAIHALKYGRQRYWLRALESWLLAGADSLLKRDGVDVIVPVPLYPLRERERGFNQAWLLVQALSREREIPSARKALARVRATETQTHLDRQERMANLHGAFVARETGRIAGKRVLLVDDVLTTGSTANECARVLRKAGATSVLVFTVARG